MLIACRAWEGLYQGLHGIEDLTVLTVNDMKDASIELDCWGREASENLIYSYGLEYEYMSECEFYEEDEEDEDDFEEEYNIEDCPSYADRGWCGYVIKEGVFSSEWEANKKLCKLGFDLFVEEYCTQEVEDCLTLML